VLARLVLLYEAIYKVVPSLAGTLLRSGAFEYLG